MAFLSRLYHLIHKGARWNNRVTILLIKRTKSTDTELHTLFDAYKRNTRKNRLKLQNVNIISVIHFRMYKNVLFYLGGDDT